MASYTLVSDCLCRWRLEHLLEKFQEENVDDEAFLQLTDELITCLVPKIGDRAKFLTNYKNNLLVFDNDKTLDIPSPALVTPVDTSSLVNLSFTEEQESSDVIDTVNEQNPSSSAAIKSVLVDTSNLDILYNLQKSSVGRLILAQKNNLTPSWRNKLASLIIEEELKSDSNERISTARFITLARQIKNIFPKENIETYYTPYTNIKGKHRRCAKGKLFDRYHNFRRTLKYCDQTNVASSSTSTYSTDTLDTENEENLDDIIQWLKNNWEPWPEVIDNWKKTFKKRLQLHKEDSVAEILDCYPALKKSLGYKLFEIDFKLLHADKSLHMYGKIEDLRKRVFKIASEKRDPNIKTLLLALEENCNENAKNAVTFLLIPYLIVPPVVTGGKKKAKWRPSKRECQETFLLHLKTVDEIDGSLERQRAKCLLHSDSLQPLPIIVGNNFSDLKAYISINNYLLEIDSVINCIDSCFKLFYSLNAKFPTDSHHIWYFLQKYVYEINNEGEKVFTNVNSFISDLNN